MCCIESFDFFGFDSFNFSIIRSTKSLRLLFCNCLLISDLVCPKVITLSGAYCIKVDWFNVCGLCIKYIINKSNCFINIIFEWKLMWKCSFSCSIKLTDLGLYQEKKYYFLLKQKWDINCLILKLLLILAGLYS